jgi:hypothetical protein
VKVVDELVRIAELDPAQSITHGALKDPVRVHEKAFDDYRNNFADDVLPEACVLDIIRTRVICPAGANTLLLNPVGVISRIDVDLGDGKRATLEIIRNKNKFKEGHEGPTHFRNMLLNCRLKVVEKVVVGSDAVPAVFFFTEMQIHNQTLLEHNNKMDSHSHYNFFRAKLQDTYESKLDRMLHNVIDTFDQVLKTPVLLSLLILTLDDATCDLPSDLLDLYRKAFITTMSRHGVHMPESVMQMLRKVACHNMFQPSKREQQIEREFSSQDMCTIFEQDDSYLADWAALTQGEQGVPLVKTLSSGADDVFQFMHLSFQEALFAIEMISNPDLVSSFWKSDDSALQMLESPLYQNSLEIGGHCLGAAFAVHRPCWCFRGSDLSKDDYRSLKSLLLLLSLNLTELDVSDCSLGVQGAQLLAIAFKKETCAIKVSSIIVVRSQPSQYQR